VAEQGAEMLKTYQLDELFGMGYSKEDIQRIDDEDTDRKDEALYMADDTPSYEPEDEDYDSL
jgi:hypothetical protein